MQLVKTRPFEPQTVLKNLFVIEGEEVDESSFHALILITHQKALFLIFQGKSLDGHFDSSPFLFKNRITVHAMGIRVSKSFNFTSEETKSFINGSFVFAAFKVKPSDKPNSNPECIVEAAGKVRTPFIKDSHFFSRQKNHCKDPSSHQFAILKPFRMGIMVQPTGHNLSHHLNPQIDEITKRLKEMKESEMRLIDRTIDLKTGKTLLTSNQIKLQLNALEEQITKTREAVKKECNFLAACLQEPPTSASLTPIVRVVADDCVTSIQTAAAYLLTVLREIYMLTESHFQSRLRIFHSNLPDKLKREKQELYKTWIFSNWEQMAPIREDFLKIDLKSPAETLTALEIKIDAFLYNTICDYVMKRPEKLMGGIDFFLHWCDLNDQILTALGLIQKQYLTSLDYAEKRSALDQDSQYLFLTLFLGLCSNKVRHPLMGILCEKLSSNFPEPLFIPLLKQQAPNLFEPFETEIKSVLDTYASVETMIKEKKPKDCALKWVRCKEALGTLLNKIPKIQVNFTGNYEKALTDIYKGLPRKSPLKEYACELKKIMHSDDNAMRVGELALLLLPVCGDHHDSFQFLSHLIRKSLLHLCDTLQFPNLYVRHWVIKSSDQTLAMRRFLYWPGKEGDPFANKCETSLPI